MGQSPIFHQYKSLDPCLQGCIHDHTGIELFFRDHSHYRCEHRVLFQQEVNRRLQWGTAIDYAMVRTVYAYKSLYCILNLQRNHQLKSNSLLLNDRPKPFIDNDLSVHGRPGSRLLWCCVAWIWTRKLWEDWTTTKMSSEDHLLQSCLKTVNWSNYDQTGLDTSLL